MDRRIVHHLLLISLALLATFVLGACGDSESSSPTTEAKRTDTTPTVDHAGHGGATGSKESDLKITMEQVSAKSGVGVPLPSRLNCTKSTPATCTGTITCPATDAADEPQCDWMADNGGHLAKIASDSEGRACTMIYGGPETVRITGTVDGEPVAVTFSRQDGCAIAAWDEASPLWTA